MSVMKKLHFCEVCGSEYRPSYAGQRACGRQCGITLRFGPILKKDLPASPPTRYTCVDCGDEFEGGRSDALRCPDCMPRKHLYHVGDTLTTACYVCSQTFSYVVNRRPRVICDSCKAEREREANRQRSRMAAKNPTPAARASRRTAKRRRRARERGAPSEPYTLEYVAQRDRFICHLCRRRVAMTKAVPHPKAPTIDHLVPLATGGHDVRANVKLAHFWCNSKRGTGGIVQLALIG